MNNLLVSSPFIVFGVLVLVVVGLLMSDGGKIRAGSSKSLTGSLSKILMGSSGKKSSKKSSKRSSGGNNKYMGFTMTQILIGAAVVGGIYYYKEGFLSGEGTADSMVNAAFQKMMPSQSETELKEQKLPSLTKPGRVKN